MQTRVGASGKYITPEQKRRVALARALIQNRPILVLDDPFTELDHIDAIQLASSLTRWRGTNGDMEVTLLLTRHQQRC